MSDRHPITTPWGRARLIEEARVDQEAGEKRFGAFAQLLETADGCELVRFAYTADGAVRRGPVTLRPEDLAALRGLLDRAPGLAAAMAPLASPSGPAPASAAVAVTTR